jgi:hypothetical protein
MILWYYGNTHNFDLIVSWLFSRAKNCLTSTLGTHDYYFLNKNQENYFIAMIA